MNILTPISIAELRNFLAAFKSDVVLCPGLGTPHLYRGGGGCLALAPVLNTTVGTLIAEIDQVISTGVPHPNSYGRTFRFNQENDVYVAQQNHYGQPLTLSALLNSVDPWLGIGEGFGR